ncbi:MAG: dihydrodipicolinate synthase family protein [Acidobacteriota bacterium]
MAKPPIDIKRIDSRRQFGRKVQGIAAALLPFQSNGRIAVEAFQRHVVATHAAGLINAVNMDTGYVNYLSEAQKNNVLEWTRAALGKNVPFVAGAYIENLEGDVVTLYRRQLDSIVAMGGIPILFQTARLKASSDRELAATYQAVCRGYQNVLAFELGAMFAANGKIFDSKTIVRLMDIPEISGMKHSSLDRLVELERLALRDRHRPDFRIFTGNDLGINMIEYGSDYLLGLATFAPEQFAERDRLWQTGNPAYYALSDALQYLGDVAFRHPVPAYKHSAALFLHLCGRIPTAKTHPKSPKRPAGEIRWLQDCAWRLADTKRNRNRAIRDATNDAQQPRGPSL